jgi:5'(3')-deoxyribonucleotidase
MDLQTRVAVDLDGVVIDLHSVWLGRIGLALGRPVPRESLWTHQFHQCVVGLTDEMVMSTYTPDLYDLVEPVPGAIDGVRRLADHYEVVVCSKSPAGFAAAKEKWLRRYLPGADLILRHCAMDEPKGGLVHDCLCLLDDYESNFAGLPASCRGILFDQPWNARVEGFARVRSWEDFTCMELRWGGVKTDRPA